MKYVRVSKNDSSTIALENFPYRHGKAYEQICLTNQDFSSSISLRKNRVVTGFDIDKDKSYVLEFTPGGFYPASSSVLHRGSFYCTTSYFVSNGESVAKSNDFKSWVDKFFKSFKKEFLLKLNDKDRIFFSSRTIEWMKQTGALVDKAFMKITL